MSTSKEVFSDPIWIESESVFIYDPHLLVSFHHLVSYMRKTISIHVRVLADLYLRYSPTV